MVKTREQMYDRMDSAWKKIIHYNFEGHYLCNRKCNTFKKKKTKNKSEVTCGQCILRLKRNEERRQEIIKENGDYIIKENIEQKKRNFFRKPSSISEEDLKLLRKRYG